MPTACDSSQLSRSRQICNNVICPQTCRKHVRSSQVVNAAKVQRQGQGQGQQQQRWTHTVTRLAEESGSTINRRRAAFTYAPQQQQRGVAEEQGQRHASRRSQVQQQQEQELRRQQQQQLRHTQHARQENSKQQHVFRPDAAADDLDVLAAEAAAVLTTGSSSTSSGAKPSASASMAMPFSPIHVVPAQAALLPARQPRYSQSDKLHLTDEAARDIARRLRKAGPPRPGQPVLRVFRYGIDDLRLYKALDLAGLEGRVVVADSMQFADAVITTRNKRTGKAVDLAVARRAAASAGVPYIQLKAISPQRLLEALGPLLGLQHDSIALAATAIQQHGTFRMQSDWASSSTASSLGPQQQQLQEAGLGHVLQNAQGLRSQPRLLRWDEAEDDSSEQLLQLLWGSQVAFGNNEDTGAVAKSSSSTISRRSRSAGSGSHRQHNIVGGAVVVGASPRWLAWCESQVGPCSPTAVWELVRSIDIEDSRDDMVPANPTQRAGEKHKLLKPLRHGSRLKHKKLLHDLRLKHTPW